MNQQVRLVLIFAGGFFLLADRIFKYLSQTFFSAPALLNKYAGWFPSSNGGIAFGLLLPRFLIILLSIIFIIILARIFKKNSDPLTRAGIFLMIIGAFSNLIDRVFFGHTLDYLLLYMSIFNLADVMIVTGAVVCIVSSLKHGQPNTSAIDK